MKLKERLKIEKQTMSPRDTILIFILGIVAVLLLGFNYLVIPKFNSMKSNYEIASKLKNEYKGLKEQNNNIFQLQKNHDEKLYSKDRMELQVPPFNSQAQTILALENEAKICNLKMGSMSFEECKIIPKNKFLSENPQEENQGDAEQNTSVTEPSIIDSIMSISVQGNYTEVYKFLKRLEENDRKYYISNIALNVGEGNSLIGNMKIRTLSYIESGNVIRPNINIPQSSGKFNIFSTTNGIESVNDGTSYYTADMLLRLNPITYQGPKFVFSPHGKFDKEIYNNSLKPIEGKLSIEKNDKNCVITYSLGGVRKTFQKEIKPKNGVMKFDVISSTRANLDDGIAINMSIENKTPFNLEVNVVNDDPNKPRFNLINKADNINVKRVAR